MPHFKVRSEHHGTDAPVVLVTAFRIQPNQQHMYRPMTHLNTGTVRRASAGDWIVSQPNEDPCIMLHEDFHANYEQAD